MQVNQTHSGSDILAAAPPQSRRPARPSATPFLLVAILAGLPACIVIEGGAVELSWTLRTFDGNVSDCAAYDIGQISVRWQAAPGGEGTSEYHRELDCESNHGVTGFEIGEGPQLIRVVPICDDGVPAREGTYEVPPPILRQVQTGEVVTLNSLLVVVGCRPPPDCEVGQECLDECTCARQ